MLFILFMDSTRFQINLMLETTGQYLGDFLAMSFYTGASGEYESWVGAWTVFLLVLVLVLGPLSAVSSRESPSAVACVSIFSVQFYCPQPLHWFGSVSWEELPCTATLTASPKYGRRWNKI